MDICVLIYVYICKFVRVYTARRAKHNYINIDVTFYIELYLIIFMYISKSLYIYIPFYIETSKYIYIYLYLIYKYILKTIHLYLHINIYLVCVQLYI